MKNVNKMKQKQKIFKMKQKRNEIMNIKMNRFK